MNRRPPVLLGSNWFRVIRGLGVRVWGLGFMHSGVLPFVGLRGFGFGAERHTLYTPQTLKLCSTVSVKSLLDLG